MNILLIDCSAGLRVCVTTPQKTVEYFDEEAKKQSDSLLEKIDELLKQAEITISQIDTIAVNIGPGSFTGIRVAISTAKGIAVGTNAKIVVFNSFESLFANITDKNFGVLVEGFGNNYYYYFKKFGKVFQGCASTDKMHVFAQDINVYSSSKTVCDKVSDFIVSLKESDALSFVKEKIEKGQFVQTNQIAPLYLRASQAEIERLKNGN